MARKSKLLEKLDEEMKDIKIDIEVLKEMAVTMKDVTDYRDFFN